MGIGALLTLFDIARSNVKEKRLVKLLQDKGVDEPIITQAVGALSYLNLSENDRRSIYKKNPSVNREEAEKRFRAILLYIFQDLEVAELVIGNRQKAVQASNEAKAVFARIEEQKKAENNDLLSLSQVEARVARLSIINYVDKLTMSDEERKVLREIADFIESKTDPILSQKNISLDISNDTLISLDFFLHSFMTDSEMASIHGSIGADSFIGDTGVRLSEMASYTHVMDGLIEKFSSRVE